jgi:hypothetical protein
MLLKASAEYDQTVSTAESCLQELGFDFQRNGTDLLAEFEIVRPAYFRVVIEPNKVPKTWNLIIPMITPPKGTTIDIRFDLDSTPADVEESSVKVREFLRKLSKALPAEPWKGLGSRESNREEKRWREMMRQ